MADVNNKIRLIICFLLFVFKPVIMNGMPRCELCRSDKLVECVGSPDKTAVCNCLKMRNTFRFGGKAHKCSTKAAMPDRQKECKLNTLLKCDPGLECVNYSQTLDRLLMLCTCPAGKECKEGVGVVKTTKQQVGSNRKEGVGVVKTTKQQVGSNRKEENTRVGVTKTNEQLVGSNRNLTPMERYGKQQQSRSNTNNINVAGSASVYKNSNQVNVAGSASVYKNSNQVNAAGSASVGSNRNVVNHDSHRPQENEKVNKLVSESTVQGAETVLGIVAAVVVFILFIIIHCHRVNSRRSAMKKKYVRAKRKKASVDPPPGWCGVSSHVLQQTFCCKSDSIVENYLPKKKKTRKKKKEDNKKQTKAEDGVSPDNIDIEITKRRKSRTGLESNRNQSGNQSENSTRNRKTRSGHSSLAVSKLFKKHSSAKPLSQYQPIYFDDELHITGKKLNQKKSTRRNNILDKELKMRRLHTRVNKSKRNYHSRPNNLELETNVVDKDESDQYMNENYNNQNVGKLMKYQDYCNIGHDGKGSLATFDNIQRETGENVCQNRNVNTNIEEPLVSIQHFQTYYSDSKECDCLDNYDYYSFDNNPVYNYLADRQLRRDRCGITYGNLIEKTDTQPFAEDKQFFNEDRLTTTPKTDFHLSKEKLGKVDYSDQSDDNSLEDGLKTEPKNIRTDREVHSCVPERRQFYHVPDRELFGILSTTVEIPVAAQDHKHMKTFGNQKESLQETDVKDGEQKITQTMSFDASTDQHYLKSYEKDGQELYYVDDSQYTELNFNQSNELVKYADSMLSDQNAVHENFEQNMDNEVFLVKYSPIDTDSNSESSDDYVGDNLSALVASTTEFEAYATEDNTLVAP